MAKVLMVAEKPSLALSIATFLADRQQVQACTGDALQVLDLMMITSLHYDISVP